MVSQDKMMTSKRGNLRVCDGSWIRESGCGSRVVALMPVLLFVVAVVEAMVAAAAAVVVVGGSGGGGGFGMGGDFPGA